MRFINRAVAQESGSIIKSCVLPFFSLADCVASPCMSTCAQAQLSRGGRGLLTAESGQLYQNHVEIAPEVGRGAGIIRHNSANETEPLPHYVFYFFFSTLSLNSQQGSSPSILSGLNFKQNCI